MLFNTAGYYLLFEITRYQARKEMMAGLRNNPAGVTVMTIPRGDPEFRWVHSREFVYKGVMYDVITREQSTQGIRFVCKPDLKETRLMAGMNRLAGEKLYRLVWSQLNHAFLAPSSVTLLPVVTAVGPCPDWCPSQVDGVRSILTPPPEFLS